jgi:hypothetical protein
MFILTANSHPKNYLTVSYESGNVPFSWVGPEKTALLLPVHFANDTVTYYLQFDTGSASTVLYSGAIDGLKQSAPMTSAHKLLFTSARPK